MTATVYLDLDQLHFVIGGVRHRPTRLQHVPQSGEAVRMLCGVIAEVEYGSRDPGAAPTTICPDCDHDYRVRRGIPTRFPPAQRASR